MARKTITRRDFVNGTLVGAGALSLATNDLLRLAQAAEAEATPLPAGAPYNPAKLTGMRGSHPGAFERAHELAREGREDWGGVTETGEDYDLVVVGGGASGLAAAYFYQDAHDWKAKVLILDNHDDFGGHAKRNEFESGGKRRMTYGGSQGFDNIGNWPDEMWTLLDDIGIDLKKFEDEYYDSTWFERHGLKAGVHLDAQTWGTDHMIPADLGDLAGVMVGIGAGSTDYEALFAATPLPPEAKDELTRLYSESGGGRVVDRLDKSNKIYTNYPYESFLKDFWGVKDPASFKFLRKLPLDESGVGIESLSLDEAASAALPGTRTLGKRYGYLGGEPDPAERYVHHFPDGNAGFCRTIVKAMITEVAPGETPADLVMADFDYSVLDDPENSTRIRLNSTAIEVKHEGPVAEADKVAVTYIFDGTPRRVRASNVVMACWNMIIPHVCRDLPADQKAALSGNVKIPYLFANVMVKNWRAIKQAGVGAVYCPTSYFTLMQLEFPVNMGGYKTVEDPNDPIPLTLIRVPVPDDTTDMSPKEQFREGRMEILAMEFAEFETEIVKQLDSMFGADGFDAARDIESITLNRWSHGYSYTYFNMFDPGQSTNDGPHIKARQKFGRITIANSDAGADSWLDVGVMEGYRAVQELING